MHRPALLKLFAVLLCSLVPTLGQSRAESSISSINPEHAFSWGHNVGWLNWRPSDMDGARIGEFVCSGSIYSANVGWINLGHGSPANGIYYENDSAADFGVNRDAVGNLRGFAYGANIGWVHFNSQGAPRVDWRTGRVEGAVYGANVGWIHLDNSSFHVQTDFIVPGRDSDGDGIPDAWKLLHAGDLESLRGDLDADEDGQTNLEEYLAGTDPFAPEDNFRIVGLQWSWEQKAFLLTFTVRPRRQYWILSSPRLGDEASWTEVGVGPVEGDGLELTVTLPGEDDWSEHYFRVQAFRPLMLENP